MGPSLGLHIAVKEVATMPVFIQSGENICSAAHTDRRSVVVLIKDDTILAELIHIGGLDFVIAIASYRKGVLIISKKKNEVGASILRIFCRASEASGEEEKKENDCSHTMTSRFTHLVLISVESKFRNK